MQECEHCGQIRPDSQTACDCERYRARFDPKPAATASMISLVTTIGIEGGLVYMGPIRPAEGLGGIGHFLLMVLLVCVGAVVNLIAGVAAYKRREPWGGALAASGVAVWVVTLLILRD